MDALKKLYGHLEDVKSEVVRLGEILQEEGVEVGAILTNIDKAINTCESAYEQLDLMEESLTETQAVVDDLQCNKYSQHLNQIHQNIRVESALESLFENFDQIGVEALEKFIETQLNPVQAWK